MMTELQTYVKEYTILPADPVLEHIHAIQDENEPELQRLNQAVSQEERRRALAVITGQDIDSSVRVLTPLFTDFGRHLSIGKHVFLNRGVMFTDLGSIRLDDHVLIGPFARLLTVNHPESPTKRGGVETAPIHVGRNAWIGAGATVLPGVTIGEDAIVAANATVTRDVPPRTIVAGTPARIIRTVEVSDE